MKRFFFSILFVAVFCIGLGALIDKAGATFKSDEKALALIQKARVAIGGDSAISSVQSMVIVGKTTRNFKIDGTDRNEQGETEIAMQFPDKLMKMVKIGDDRGTGEGMKMIDKQVDVVVAGSDKSTMDVTVETGDNNVEPVKKIVIKKPDGTVQEFTGEEADKIIAADGASAAKGVKTIVIKRPDGSTKTYTGAEADKIAAQNGDSAAVWTTKDGKTVNVKENVILNRAGDHHGAMKQNELLRLTLSLLITAPQGMEVSYTYGGESSVDGTACNIVNATFAGSTFKLYLGQTSNLPVMMTYTGMKMPMMMKFKSEGAKSGEPKDKDHTVFLRKVDGPPMETAEFSVKFSDFRSVNGIQLPFKWTQTVGGTADETFDVTGYDINPANIADRFQHQKVKVRTATPAAQ